MTLRACDGAVQTSDIAGGRFNIVRFFVVHTRLLALAGSWGRTVVFRGEVPEVHAAGVEDVSTGVTVVRQVHAFDEDGCSVHDDALLGVVVKDPIAALHGPSGGGVNPGPDRTRHFKPLKRGCEKRRTNRHPSFVRTLTGIARITHGQVAERGR